MSAGLPSFFKTPRNRSFNYKPIIYDEQKERKEELNRLVAEQRAGVVSDDRRTERLRSMLNQRWASRSRQTNGQNLRLIFILSALGGLIWLFFNWG